MTVLRLGGGREYQTVREYLDIVSRNAYSLMRLSKDEAERSKTRATALEPNA